MAWVTTCPKCGRERVFNHKAGTCYECTPADGVPKNRERKENASANAVVLLAECNRLTAERDRIAAERDELQEEVKRLDWKRQENKAFAILYRKDLEDARADIDALTAERDKWRLAVIDAAVVNWTYSKEDEDNPYLAVCKLLGCAARDALDPQISLEAKALHDRIAELETTDHYQRSLEEMHLRYNAEAERDELQRRLDAVVMEHIRTAELKCYCEFDRDHERTMECEYCEEVAALRAIAEGRE